MIGSHEYADFMAAFRKGAHQQERFGQAFLNKFHNDPDVAKQRGNCQLWEEKNPFKADALIREELQLIDYGTHHALQASDEISGQEPVQ